MHTSKIKYVVEATSMGMGMAHPCSITRCTGSGVERCNNEALYRMECGVEVIDFYTRLPVTETQDICVCQKHFDVLRHRPLKDK